MQHRTRKLIFVNAITSLRLFGAIAVVWLIAEGYWIAATFCLLGGVATDLVDGYLARRWEVTTSFGAKFDAQLDRILEASPLVGMMIAHSLPIWLGSILIVGLWGSDWVTGKFPIRAIWWAVIYVIIFLSLMAHVSTVMRVAVIIAAVVTLVIVAIAKPDERREVFRALHLIR